MLPLDIFRRYAAITTRDSLRLAIRHVISPDIATPAPHCRERRRLFADIYACLLLIRCYAMLRLRHVLIFACAFTADSSLAFAMLF